MSHLTARSLHQDQKGVLDAVERGESFSVHRGGKLIARILPANEKVESTWDEIMVDVWAAQKKVSAKTKNPVLAERQRRRR